MSHLTYLQERLRLRLLRAVSENPPRARAVRLVDHHSGFDDTLIVDGEADKPHHTVRPVKADERYMASSDDINEIGHLIVLWVCSVLLAILIPAIVLQVSWADVMAWLEMLGNAIAAAPLGGSR